MSLEKCIALYLPLKANKICTVKTAKWVTGIVGILLAGYDLQYLIMYEARFRKDGTGYCKLYGTYILTLSTIDSALYSFGPFALMSITNFTIGLKFLRAKCKSDQSNSTESKSQALGESCHQGDSYGGYCFCYISTSYGTKWSGQRSQPFYPT